MDTFFLATLTNHLIGGNGEPIIERVSATGDTEAEAREELANIWGCVPHECRYLTVVVEAI